jgi:DNA-binding NtrC family response regulator
MLHLAGDFKLEFLDEPRSHGVLRSRARSAAAVQLSMEGIHSPQRAPLAKLEQAARMLLDRTRRAFSGDGPDVQGRLETIRALAIAHPDHDTYVTASASLALLQLERGHWASVIDILDSALGEGLPPTDEAFSVYVQCLARSEIGPPSTVLTGCARALKLLAFAEVPSLRARIRRLALDGYRMQGDRIRARRVLDRMRDAGPAEETEALLRLAECDLLHSGGRLEAAEAAARDAWAIARRPGSPGVPHAPGTAAVIRRLAVILLDLQRPDEARRKALEAMEGLDPACPSDRREIARLRSIMARIDLQESEESRAWESLRVAERFFRQTHSHRDRADLLVLWGETAAVRQVETALRREAREGLFEARAIYRRLCAEEGIRRCDLALECLRAPVGNGDRVTARPPRPPRTRRLTQLGFLTCDPAVLLALEPLEALVGTSIPILIHGESGTGKEVLSRALHRAAGVRGPFVAVNCGALPSELQESELFGHVRGAFTGAVADKVGLFEAADGGTLLLDEVGEMTPRAQVKLLRILELGEVRRVGETRTRRVHARVIAATNADLAEQLRTGAFRRDLFFRLCGLKVSLPALRERRGDVPLLATHFARLFGGAEAAPLSIAPEALDRLLVHDWPGNVRELRFTMERAVALSRALGRERIEADCIDPEGLPGDALGPAPVPIVEDLGAAGGLDAYLMNTERRLILKALEENGWNRTHAARSLGGISRTTLIGKMKRLGLFPDGGGEPAAGVEAVPLG